MLQVLRPQASRGSLATAAGKGGFGAVKVDPSVEALERPCTCGSGKPYSACCHPFHSKDAVPSDAEAALRARFSAYALKDSKFIVRSTHPRNPATKGSQAVAGSLVRMVKTTFVQDVRASMSIGDFSGLTIQGVEPGATEEEVFVRFEYTMKQVRSNAGAKLIEPRIHAMKERARFQKRENEWLLLGSETNWDKTTMRTLDAEAEVKPEAEVKVAA